MERGSRAVWGGLLVNRRSWRGHYVEIGSHWMVVVDYDAVPGSVGG